MKTCPRCNQMHIKRGTYCSRKCANIRIISDQQRKTISITQKIHWKNNKQKKLEYWTEDKRKQFSNIMKQTVLKNPDSYSKNNVSGRVKMYEINSPYGLTKVKGKWELSVAIYLNKNNIKWTNDITPFQYYWNNNWHFYFPDFYLIDKDIFLEVKGYKTDRDDAKWSVVKNLIVIDKNNINNLENIMSV